MCLPILHRINLWVYVITFLYAVGNIPLLLTSIDWFILKFTYYACIVWVFHFTGDKFVDYNETHNNLAHNWKLAVWAVTLLNFVLSLVYGFTLAGDSFEHIEAKVGLQWLVFGIHMGVLVIYTTVITGYLLYIRRNVANVKRIEQVEEATVLMAKNFIAIPDMPMHDDKSPPPRYAQLQNSTKNLSALVKNSSKVVSFDSVDSVHDGVVSKTIVKEQNAIRTLKEKLIHEQEAKLAELEKTKKELEEKLNNLKASEMVN